MKVRNIILIAGTVVFISLLSLGTLLKQDIAFSENENRYLSEKPALSLSDVLSGRFETQSENYLTDQIIGRESWVKVKSSTESLLGIKDINGVYLCKDGRVVEKITAADFDKDRFEKNLSNIKELEEICDKNGILFNILPVPTAAYIYKSELPAHGVTFDEDGAFDTISRKFGSSLIDIRKDLGDATENVFYYTDHHWTNYGAFIAYKAFCKESGITNSFDNYDDYNPEILTEDFKGTLYSKVLLDNLKTDTIEAPKLAETTLKVSFEGDTYDSLLFKDNLKKKDKYGVFLGGNYDKVEIETGREGGKLLIIKDSFANSFAPYMLEDFSKITMIDTRYYKDDVSEIATECDQVLVLYSMKAFGEEKINLTGAFLK